MTIAVAVTKEALAAEYTGLALYASLHTADPGQTGASEVVGGTPAYARVLVTWTAGTADGIYTATLATPFDVPAGTTVTHVGFWTASTAGTFVDHVAHAATFPAQGQLTVDDLTYTQA